MDDDISKMGLALLEASTALRNFYDTIPEQEGKAFRLALGKLGLVLIAGYYMVESLKCLALDGELLDRGMALHARLLRAFTFLPIDVLTDACEGFEEFILANFGDGR